MRRSARVTAVAIAVALGGTVALPARAASFWDRVRDPASARAEDAMRLALRARLPREIPGDDLPAFDSLLALRAATVLEMAGGAALDDPEVLFFLGNALVLADRGRDEEAREILRRGLTLAPSAPEASRAWFDYAIASNRVHDFEAERLAYGEALRSEWDRNRRASVHMNRGEASMSLGDLAAAREDYLVAIETTTESEAHALASWGLAVALARDDDLPDALRYAWEASRMRFVDAQGNPITALDLPSVFFTPPHEVFYYRALAAMAAAEHAEDAAARKMELEWAVSQWHHYLSAARESGDRWVANVNFQLKWCERRLDAMTVAKPKTRLTGGRR
jgi:tetratricopeptide (TPR) repeat protein